MDILYGIKPLDELYGYEDGKPCLATLVCSACSQARRAIEVPLLSKCLEDDLSVVFYGIEPSLGLTGSRAEVECSINVQERLHKITMIDPTNFDVGQLRNEARLRDADILIVKPPVWRLYDTEGGYDGFYRTLKDISREMCKKIVVLAKDIEDVVTSRRHADMTLLLLLKEEE